MCSTPSLELASLLMCCLLHLANVFASTVLLPYEYFPGSLLPLAAVTFDLKFFMTVHAPPPIPAFTIYSRFIAVFRCLLRLLLSRALVVKLCPSPQYRFARRWSCSVVSFDGWSGSQCPRVRSCSYWQRCWLFWWPPRCPPVLLFSTPPFAAPWRAVPVVETLFPSPPRLVRGVRLCGHLLHAGEPWDCASSARDEHPRNGEYIVQTHCVVCTACCWYSHLRCLCSHA